MENAGEQDPNIPDGLFGVLERIQDDYGLGVLVLFIGFLFVCFLLWKLIWNVWSAALKSKDDEIERLVQERDKYQALFFERLKSSAVKLTPRNAIDDKSGSESDMDEN